MIATKLPLIAVLALSSTVLVACDSGSDTQAPETSAQQPAEKPVGVTKAPVELQPRRPVLSDNLPYAEVGDELVYGHFVFPSDMIDPLPAVVVVHERWGLNDDVRKRADMLAGEGYIVLAVDLFHGKTAKEPAEARRLMTAVIENPNPAASNIRNAVEFVSGTAGAPSTALLGWGFGGTWAVNAAGLLGDDVDATVVYYGQVTSDEDNLRPVSSPLLGLFGGKDRAVTSDSVEALRHSLERLRKDFQIQVYPEAGSGFANPSSNNYDPTAAEDAWQRTLEFLNAHLAAVSGAAS